VLLLNAHALASNSEGSPTLCVDGVDTTFRTVEELGFAIETGSVMVYETVNGRDLADFNLVQVLAYPRPTGTLLSGITDYLDSQGVPCIGVAGVGAPTKLQQCIRFALAGLPVPVTIYLAPALLVDSYSTVVDKLGLPFILKALSTSGGRYNYLIASEHDFARQTADLRRLGVQFLVQELIPNFSTVRLLVLGGDVNLAIHRTCRSGTHLTNTAQGGHAVLLSPSNVDPTARKLATQAAGLVDCDIAGVNLIQHWASRRWYVLEANPTPAIGTGAFVEDKMRAYSSYLTRRLTERSVR
jgi:glutathione synthase/RimK-type ligase-like ATP-grasp enzyme